MTSMTSRIYWLLAFSAVGVLVAGGCQQRGPLKTRDAVGDFFDGFAEQAEADEPMTLTVSGPVDVDVENFAGDVRVEVDESRETAVVHVERIAEHGFGRKKEAKATLSSIAWDAEIVSGELGPVLQVRTRSKGMEPYLHSANVSIAVPEISGLRVKTRNGDVDARGVSGPIDVRNDSGDVLIVAGEPIQDPVTIINRKGDIDLRMGGDSQAMFDCETIDGKVMHRLTLGKVKVMQDTDGDTLKARLNGGENRIVLRNVGADIRIAAVPNPNDFGAAIYR